MPPLAETPHFYAQTHRIMDRLQTREYPQAPTPRQASAEAHIVQPISR